MAHYRNLTVDGRDYRYVVGKNQTYVQQLVGGEPHGPKVGYVNSEWGTRLGEGPVTKFTTYVIAPGDVVGMIRGKKRWANRQCDRHPHITITGLAIDPDSEIHGRGTLVSNCPECLEESWMDT